MAARPFSLPTAAFLRKLEAYRIKPQIKKPRPQRMGAIDELGMSLF
jgi:hypothetical protein